MIKKYLIVVGLAVIFLALGLSLKITPLTTVGAIFSIIAGLWGIALLVMFVMRKAAG